MLIEIVNNLGMKKYKNVNRHNYKSYKNRFIPIKSQAEITTKLTEERVH